MKKLITIWVAVLVFLSGLSVTHADIIEVTATGKLTYFYLAVANPYTNPNSPYNFLDSSVFLYQTYKYTARYDTQNTGDITYGNSMGVMYAIGNYYPLNPFYSKTTFGNYTIISTLGNASVYDNFKFDINIEQDYLGLSSTSGTVQNTNSSAIPAFNGYTNIGLYDNSHTVFSSAQLPSVNAYNLSNFNSGGAIPHPTAQFEVFDRYDSSVTMQGTVETLNAVVVPEPATLLLLGLGTVMLRRKLFK